MTVDPLDHVIILGLSWRWIVASTLISVGTTMYVTLAWPPMPEPVKVVVLDHEAIARETWEAAELKGVLNGLHPSQNEYWTAREHLRATEARLRALKASPPPKKPTPPVPWSTKILASILGGAFSAIVVIWCLAYWRAAANERPIKARVFDLREKGYIR